MGALNRLLFAFATGFWATSASSAGFGVASAAEMACGTPIRVAFGSEELPDAVATAAANERLASVESELRAIYRDPYPFSQRAALNTIQDPESPANRKFLEKTFGKSCLLGRPTAATREFVSRLRTNLGIGYGLVAVGWGSTVVKDPEHRIPFAALASVAVLGLVNAEICCRSLVNDSAATPSNGAKAPASARIRKGLKTYRNYAVLSVPGTGLFVGLTAVEDKLRANDMSWQKYTELGAFSLIWNLSFAAVNVVALDPLYLKALPSLRESLRSHLASRISPAQLKPLASAPGWALEAAIRVGIAIGRTQTYVELNDRFADLETCKRLSEILGVPVLPAEPTGTEP